MKIEPQHERLPRKFSQGTRPGPRLRHLPDVLTFIWKYVFLNNSGAFKDFRHFFFMETLGLKFEFNFFQIKKKSIFSASEGGK